MHVGRALVPHSAASGPETGLESLLQVRLSTPSAQPARLQLVRRLPYGTVHRVVAVAHAPLRRHANVTCTHAEQHLLSIPPVQRLCAAVRTLVYSRGKGAWSGVPGWAESGFSWISRRVGCWGLESRHLERRPKAAARLDLEVSAGWARAGSRGLWGGALCSSPPALEGFMTSPRN